MPPARIAELMRGAPRDLAVAQAGATALWTVAFDPANREACCSAGIIELLCSVLREHSGSSSLCRAACSAMQSLGTEKDSSKDAFVAAGALPALASVLREHSAVASAVQASANAVAILCAGSKGPQLRVDACLAAGLPPLLCAALRAHVATERGVAEACAGALRNLAWSRSSARQQLVEQGAVPLLLQAGRSHPAAGEVVAQALDKLGFTAAGVPVPVRQDLPTAEMPPSQVLQLLAAAPGDGAVAAAAATALWHIAFEPANRQGCVAAGAIRALAGLLSSHAGSAPICRAACSALQAVCADSDSAKDAAVAAGALPLCTAVLRAHDASTPECVQASANAMAIICAGSGQQRQRADAAVNASAVPALVAVLRAHSATGSLCQTVAGCLRNIAWSNPGHKRLVAAAGAVPLLVAAAAEHSVARENAVQALERLGLDAGGGRLAQE